MKKIIPILSISLFLLVAMNTVTTMAQPKIYSQGFYTMKDLNLAENTFYTIQNREPYSEGFLIIIDSNKKIQQLIRIQPNSTKVPLIPLQNDFRFIVYGNVQLIFS